MVSSSQDFGVEQFFWADEFRAVDPSPIKDVFLFQYFTSWIYVTIGLIDMVFLKRGLLNLRHLTKRNLRKYIIVEVRKLIECDWLIDIFFKDMIVFNYVVLKTTIKKKVFLLSENQEQIFFNVEKLLTCFDSFYRLAIKP